MARGEAAQLQTRFFGDHDARYQAPLVEAQGAGDRAVAGLVAHENEGAGPGEDAAVVLFRALDPAPRLDRIGDADEGDIAAQFAFEVGEFFRCAGAEVDNFSRRFCRRRHGHGKAR